MAYFDPNRNPGLEAQSRQERFRENAEAREMVAEAYQDDPKDKPKSAFKRLVARLRRSRR
jgi:hypothetical protein